MTNQTAINSLIDITKSWGGTLDLVTLHEYNATVFESQYKKNKGWSTPPDDFHALHWENKRIITVADKAMCGFLIHEMGHLFLNMIDPFRSNEDEWEWLGWEIALAKLVGCYKLWSEHNGSYFMPRDPERPGENLVSWGRANAKTKSVAAYNRLRHAKDIGILDASYQPIPKR